MSTSTPGTPTPPHLGIGICLIGNSSEFTRNLKASIANTPGFRELLHLDHSKNVFPRIRQYAPELILIDIRLAADSGFRFLRNARERFSQSRFLVIADQDQDPLVLTAVTAGADGCIYSHNPLEKVINDIRRAIEGLPILPDSVTSRILREYVQQLQQATPRQTLSDTEWRLLELTSEGKSCQEIAACQGIPTVAVYAMNKSIYARLNINSRVAAIAWYRSGVAIKNTLTSQPS